VTRLLILAGACVALLALRNRSPESAIRIAIAVAIGVAAGGLLGAAHRIAGAALALLAIAVGLALSTRSQIGAPRAATRTPTRPPDENRR
jgi:hypothetical protein